MSRGGAGGRSARLMGGGGETGVGKASGDWGVCAIAAVVGLAGRGTVASRLTMLWGLGSDRPDELAGPAGVSVTAVSLPRSTIADVVGGPVPIAAARGAGGSAASRIVAAGNEGDEAAAPGPGSGGSGLGATGEAADVVAGVVAAAPVGSGGSGRDGGGVSAIGTSSTSGVDATVVASLKADEDSLLPPLEGSLGEPSPALPSAPPNEMGAIGAAGVSGPPRLTTVPKLDVERSWEPSRGDCGGGGTLNAAACSAAVSGGEPCWTCWRNCCKRRAVCRLAEAPSPPEPAPAPELVPERGDVAAPVAASRAAGGDGVGGEGRSAASPAADGRDGLPGRRRGEVEESLPSRVVVCTAKTTGEPIETWGGEPLGAATPAEAPPSRSLMRWWRWWRCRRASPLPVEKRRGGEGGGDFTGFPSLPTGDAADDGGPPEPPLAAEELGALADITGGAGGAPAGGGNIPANESPAEPDAPDGAGEDTTGARGGSRAGGGPKMSTPRRFSESAAAARILASWAQQRAS